MKIKATIERSSSGLYSAYSDDRFGNSCLGGFGDSVENAKADFLVSVEEALEEASAEGFEVPNIEDVEVEYLYDIPSLFDAFDFLNVSKFAKFAGINESKMRAYKSGVAFPGEKTAKKIAEALSKIGKEISSVSLRI